MPTNTLSVLSRIALALTLLFGLANQARAQQRGFALDHLNPAERGSEWFAADTLDLRGHLRPALGVTGSWSYRPLVARDEEGNFERSVVRNQFVLHLGGSLVISERVRIGLNVPIQAYADGRAITIADTTFAPPANKTSLGDIRLAADLRLFGAYGNPFTIAAGLVLWLPSGDRNSYAGDGIVRLLPQILIAGDINEFVYAARVGFSIRPKDDAFADSFVGSSVMLALAAGFRVADKRLVIGPELITQTVVSQGDVLSQNNAPLELILGAHYTLPVGMRIGAGFGMGLSTSFRAPQHRGLLTVEWAPRASDKSASAPPALPPDRDGDRVLDATDQCPDQPGEARYNGCPPPADRDSDGVTDDQDECPDQPGEPQLKGCPPPDRDRDTIVDAQDACPDTTGVASADPTKNGCPLPLDRDADGLVDDHDACPDAAGPADPDPKRSGCPKAFLEGGQIRILDQVRFQTGKASIVPGHESEEMLVAVLGVLRDHPEVAQIRVEGHTDNKGSTSFNHTLSQQRAQAVVDWLKKHGVAGERLASAGFGPDKPLATNDTEEGRSQNRRVEFHIQAN
jgi:outer membrane protein OmpA-like peptidoglycan-associated protein